MGFTGILRSEESIVGLRDWLEMVNHGPQLLDEGTCNIEESAFLLELMIVKRDSDPKNAAVHVLQGREIG